MLFSRIRTGKAVGKYGNRLSGGDFCRISSTCMDALPGGRMGERAGRSGTGKIFKGVAGEKIEKVEKNRKIVLTFDARNAILTKSVGDTDKKPTDKTPMWGLSSAGRASALQAEGHRFEPYRPHIL